MSKIHLGSWANVIDRDGVIWMSEFMFNCLFTYDVKTEEICFKGTFEDENINTLGQHCSAFDYGDRVIFSPLLGSSIGIYLKGNGLFESVLIPDKKNNEEYFPACRFGNCFFILSNEGKMFRFDANTNELFDEKDLSNKIHTYFNLKKSAVTSYEKGFVIVHENKIFMVDVKRMTIEEILDWSEKSYELGDTHLCDGRLWITLVNDQNLFSYNFETNETVEYAPENNSWLNGRRTYPYSLFKVYNGLIWISNYYCSHISYIDEENKRIKEILNPKELMALEKNGFGPTFFGMHEYEGELYIVPNRGNMLMKIDASTKSISVKNFFVDTENLKMMKTIVDEYCSLESKSGFIKEQELVGLCDFIRSI